MDPVKSLIKSYNINKGLFCFNAFFISYLLLTLELFLSKLLKITYFYYNNFLLVTVAIASIGIGTGLVFLFKNLFSGEKILRYLLFLFCSLFVLILALYFKINLYGLCFLILILFINIGVILALIFEFSDLRLYKLYFYNIIGSGIGALLFPFLLKTIGLAGVLWIMLMLITGLICVLSYNIRQRSIIIPVIVISILIFSYRPLIRPFPCGFGDRKLYEQKVSLTRWNQFSRIDVSKNKSFVEWSLSPVFNGGKTRGYYYSIDCVRSNANFKYSSIITDFDNLNSLKHDLPYLPYILLRDDSDILIIGPGGGKDVLAANLEPEKHRITAVEINPLIIDVLKEYYPISYKNVYDHANVELIISEARNFLSRDVKKYDLINIPIVKTQSSLASPNLKYEENYLYTIDAFKDYLHHLKNRGIISITWYSRHKDFFMRIISTIKELQPNHTRNVAMVDNKNFATLLIKKNGFTENELEKINSTSQERGFTVLYPTEGSSWISDYIKGVESGTGLNVDYVTDNRPFFYKISKNKKDRVLISLSILSAGILLLIYIISRFKYAPKMTRIIPIFFYFLGLGGGYIILEQFLIQRLSFLIGQPMFGFSVALSSLLIFNGIGCITFSKIKVSIKSVFCAILILLILYSLTATQVFHFFSAFGLVHRILFSIFIIAPIGCVTGVPFPYGLNKIKSTSRSIAYAWTINSLATVLGGCLGLLIAMTFGFNFVLIFAMLFYGLSLKWASYL